MYGIGKEPVMATATRTLGDGGGRMTPAQGVMPYALARTQGIRETAPRHAARAFLLGLDDATLATFGHDRSGVAHAGRNSFPL